MLTSTKTLAIVLSLFLIAAAAPAQREYGGIATRDVIQNTRANCEKYPDAAKARDAATSAAQTWVGKSDEELWTMVPGQELPRTIDVTWDYNYPKKPLLGCLKCGMAISRYGNYPYDPDFENKPWKLTCPSCGVVFPTNDFGKYYQSGIDEHGVFNPKKADRSLLYNAEHPDPKDPLHLYGVDDGYGYIDANGRAHKFIGYYGWKYWRYILGGVTNLSNAYLYTGDQRYAHKAAVLLDRIADVYPDMDWKKYADLGWYHSDGGNRIGKIEGRIWETQTVANLARAYDRIISGTVNDPALYDFLGKKAQQYKLPSPKGSRATLIANIDKGLLETAADAIISGQVRGNEGMHQNAMAMCALALDTQSKTGQWLDWLFQADGGHLPTMAVQLFDRDGMADEAAPGYCYLWTAKIAEIMNILEPYPNYNRNRLSRDFPTLRNTFKAPWKVQLLNTFAPNIGDTGAVGTLSTLVSPELIASGFKFYNDAEAARDAWEANGNSAKGLLMDYGSSVPETLNNALAKAAQEYPDPEPVGEHMPGYGLASFEQGDNADGKGLWMYYGRDKGHGHQDRLNYGIYAFHTDLTPDLGYPEFANNTWPRRAAWNNNTISHNCVVVDKSVQLQNWTGYPRFFTAQPGFGAAEVESRNVYPQTKEYARTISFVQTPDNNAYALDIFRVEGGKDHLLSFHGPAGDVTPASISMTRQTTGTYAGENVAYGDNSKDLPYGYSYLENVERSQAAPAPGYSFDWKAAAGYRGVKASDDIHMRFHVLSQVDDVALADGVPAPNKPGNPEHLRYALLHRDGKGSELASQFVTLAEPWQNQPFITSATLLSSVESTSSRVAAVKVSLKDGTEDYFISNPDGAQVKVNGGPVTDGRFAWARLQGGKLTSASLTAGTSLEIAGAKVNGPGTLRGKLVRFEKDITKPACAWIQLTAGDGSALVGQEVHFDNDRNRTACYAITAAEKDGDLWKITTGPGTFIRGFKDTKDYSKGYTFNIKEGAAFTVPVTITR